MEPYNIRETESRIFCKKGTINYNVNMAERTLDQKIDALTEMVGKGFAAVAEDISSVKEDISSVKEDVSSVKYDIAKLDNKVDTLQIQVNSIEQQLRETKAQVRLADLEEEVFGKVRA